MKDYLSKEELDGIDESPEEEVALAQSPGSTGGFNFAFSAFGESFNLQLQKNEKILSPTAQIVSRSGDKIENIGVKGSDCHYIHRGDDFVASISLCGNNSAHGYITTSDGRTFEVQELTHRETPEKRSENATSHRENKMLKIKRAHIPSGINSEPFEAPVQSPSKRAGPSRRIIETAVFVDEEAVRKFDPFLQRSNEKLRDFIVSYMNGVQSLYHHGSLRGVDFDISIVRIELLRSQPSNLPTHGGERTLLLKSFCRYQSKENKNKNGEAGHWDIGVYISGLDFYAVSGGRSSKVTMGLSAVDAICTNDYNCVIAELGTTNYKNKPYPSSGFTSVYVLAHELGHNLGLHHDGKSGNTCGTNGFIMSASRGTKGESTWSSCSADKLRSKEHSCLQNDPSQESEYSLGKTLPGQKWNSDKQCQIFLLDREARTYHTQDTLEEICHALKCKTDNRLGIYRAGPALEGTLCGEGKWCREGKCVKSKDAVAASTSGTWSEWTKGPCESSCTAGSKGVRKNTRTCNNPYRTCNGKSTDVELCDDSCSSRQAIKAYAGEACGKFKVLKPNLIANGEQVRYSEKKTDLACNIYCENKLSSGASQWYSPVLDFNDNPELDAHFPDGTLCNIDAQGNRYYCLKHNCILEGARSGKSAGMDIIINQNAKENEEIPESLQDLFSLDKNLTPIKTSLTQEDLGNADEEEEIEDDDVFVF
eukprot:TRINITY_DN3254_c1_g1_i1.p1 TRINITY_DN3254_c1_g1~~TRINITY_DN3254_c1_g1_i1.p1  ORF type:complete len:740 (+),score=167.70 TRINITY_DN3254_c1_g1_i1:104-2221(+)